MEYYNLYDIPLYLIVCIAAIWWARLYQSKKQENNIAYKYFTIGLCAKILAVSFFCLVYTHHYKGGDTLGYHSSAQVMVNLLHKSPSEFFSVIFGDLTFEKRFYFNSNTGYPGYWGDVKSFNVIRIASFFELLSFKSFLITSILMAIASYLSIWRLYLVVSKIYPTIHKMLFIGVILMPSTLFWGSGILKDTISLTGVSLLIAGVLNVWVLKRRIHSQIIPMVLGAVLIVLVKPYIFVGLLPPCLLLIFHRKITAVKNVLLRIFLLPVIFLVIIGFGAVIWITISPALGVYGNMDEMLKKAKVSQEDLKRDYYDGNSFDIGEFDPSLGGIMSKFPQATIAGLFRPFLWEANNIAMLISGIENAFLLGLLVYVFFKGPLKFIKSLGRDEVVVFSVVFAILFAFSIGISTSNFGALVRFKIPIIPFIMIGMVVILNKKELEKLKST